MSKPARSRPLALSPEENERDREFKLPPICQEKTPDPFFFPDAHYSPSDVRRANKEDHRLATYPLGGTSVLCTEENTSPVEMRTWKL